MCHALLQVPRFFTLLLTIDLKQAALTREAGCPCSGRLDAANYPRKPRGCLPEFRSGFDQRLSFCWATRRKRTTSMAVRFLGRRVYLALVVVLRLSRHTGSTSGAVALADEVAVPLRNLERCRLWWIDAFVVTPLWLAGCGALMPPVDTDGLPASLLERFVAADAPTRLIGLLNWLRPLTVRAAVPAAACPGDHAA